MISTRNNVTLHEAKKARFQPHFVLQILIFVVIFFVVQILTGFLMAGIGAATMFVGGIPETVNRENPTEVAQLINDRIQNMGDGMTLLMLLGTLIGILIAIIYCRFIEKRSLNSMGFALKNFFPIYLKGYFWGILLILAAEGIALLTGAMTFDGVVASIPWGFIFLFFLGFMIQGLSEEVLLRGYFLVSLANRTAVAAAVGISSVMFALLHLMNSGISWLAIINLILFGVFAAIYFLRTDSIWGIAAFHSAWNFVQGNVLGVLVSGQHTASRIFTSSAVDGKELFSGGAFGLEGGLAVTIVFVIAIAVLLYLPQQPRPEIVVPEAEPLPIHDPVDLGNVPPVA